MIGKYESGGYGGHVCFDYADLGDFHQHENGEHKMVVAAFDACLANASKVVPGSRMTEVEWRILLPCENENDPQRQRGYVVWRLIPRRMSDNLPLPDSTSDG